jgi:hypothetical protein
MNKASIASIFVLLAAAGCSHNENRRPAATPATEPYPESTYVAPEPADQPPVNNSPSPDMSDPKGSPSTDAPWNDGQSMAAPPVDQGNSQADIQVTKSIREAMMANDQLSFSAKNVDISTSDGKVTLRGAVKSASERAAVESAARKVDGVREIDNELVVTQ